MMFAKKGFLLFGSCTCVRKSAIVMNFFNTFFGKMYVYLPKILLFED